MQDEAHSAPPGTWFSDKAHRWSRGQGIAAVTAIILLAIAGLWTLHPFCPRWAGVVSSPSRSGPCISAAARWPAGRKLALPAGFTLLILLLFVIPLVMVAVAILHDSVSAMQWLATAKAQGVPVPDLLRQLPYGAQMAAWWQSALSTPGGSAACRNMPPRMRGRIWARA
jgi:hypothetical protein